MAIYRIVSFLPSATRLLYELGMQDKVYGELMNAGIHKWQF